MSDTIAFEHFDPEFELGNLDTQGRPIRPRKKPGRKPNPPSPAQRKAQNRAAQRAFRERKRREMRDAESLVKKCIYARDCALRDNRRLQKRVEELKFETNYLKGYALTLKMACIANQVDVPKFYDTGLTDEIGSDKLTFSKTKGVPQQLELFLDKHLNIINLSDQPSSFGGDDQIDPPSSILSPSPHSISSCSSESFSCYSDDLKEDIDFDMNYSDASASAAAAAAASAAANSLSSIAPQLASHLETPFFQQLLNTDLVGPNPFCATNTDTPTTTTTTTTPTDDTLLLLDPKTGLPRQTTPPFQPSEKEDSNKKSFPPMTPLDAIQQMRAVRNYDAGTRALFIPTELQRSTPHDTRIDVVPGAAIRDHMILFQDFYDANQLFCYLQENAVFLGGELGNPDAWFVPPSFYKHYWFLCPNHKQPSGLDNRLEIKVNLGKKLIQVMNQRKQMYIQRDQYPEHFPDPTTLAHQQLCVDKAFMESEDQVHLDDIYRDFFSSMNHEEETMTTTTTQTMDLLASDLPLEHFITMINDNGMST